ncbi:MAG: GYD domain-containing protein [Acidobacteriota bacterium]|jgi:uncharacterized protein with GYD domain
MAKYMIRASYNADGVSRLRADGASKRREVAEKLVTSLGGTMEAFYFCFGDDDLIVIVDVPDNVSAAAASLAVNAGGVVAAKTTVLLTTEEMDQATRAEASYSPPGQ